MTAVLILDANQRSALAVTRSLGKQQVTVYTADETADSLAGSSTYCTEHIQHPCARENTDDFINWLSDICARYQIDIVFPITELTCTLLLESKDQLPAIKLPLASANTINALADKCELMRLASTLNIAIPPSQFRPALNSDNRNQALQSVTYPQVLKPGKSWIKIDNSWQHTTVRFADNAEQAQQILSTDPAFTAHPYLLQENVPGHGEGVFALYNQGKAVAFFAHKRLREKPPRGGVSVLSQSVDVNPALRESAKAILDKANWHGVAMVEFRVDDAGNAYLMEINTRFWGSLQLAVDSGVDFPWLLYQMTNQENVSEVSSYRIGRRLRWFLGDVDSLYLTLRDKEFTLTNKLTSLLNFLTPHVFITRHEVNRLTDLKPFFWEIKHYIKALLN